MFACSLFVRTNRRTHCTIVCSSQSEKWSSVPTSGIVLCAGETLKRRSAVGSRTGGLYRSAPIKCCVWAFDLLYLDGKALRRHVLSAQVLERLILRVRNGWIRRNFTRRPRPTCGRRAHGAQRYRVQNGRDAYRSGAQSNWSKVKCPTWRERNGDRWRLFQRWSYHYPTRY